MIAAAGPNPLDALAALFVVCGVVFAIAFAAGAGWRLGAGCVDRALEEEGEIDA